MNNIKYPCAFGAIAFVGILGACVPEEPNTTKPVSPSKVVIGTKAINPKDAIDVFEKACFNTAPNFNKASAILAADANFTQSAKTKTFFHKTYNLSLNATQRNGQNGCSMVFQTVNPADQVIPFMVHFAAKSGGNVETDYIGGRTLHKDTSKNVEYTIHIGGLSLLSMRN